MTKDETYKLIQDFLKEPPIVIWGSGATIAYGLPSMDELNNVLKTKYDFFDKSNTNLEEELGNPKYESRLNDIRKTIWNHVYEKDNSILCDISYSVSSWITLNRARTIFLSIFPT